MYGWNAKVLRVNLTNGVCADEDLNPNLLREFIGGRGLGTKILFDEVLPTVSPLSAENKLIFATGPATGTQLGSCRYVVVTKSPLTGGIACSNAGGHFGPALKFAGYDAIIFEGRAKEPVYLSVCNDAVEIRPASHLWGKSTNQTEDMIRDEVGYPEARKTKIACIGPAGEKLVKIAAIINDKHRAAARSGVGAVMGSKNLKAIAVRGTGRVAIADSVSFREAIRSYLDLIKKAPSLNKETTNSYFNQGTPALVNVSSAKGTLPVRNFQGAVFSEVGKINGECLSNTILRRNAACFSCPVACGRLTEVKTPDFEGEGGGPEYETIALLGSSCGVSNLPAIAKAGYLCNEFGLDTIDMGGAIACAMELSQRGFLSESEVGFKLNFGNAKAMVELVRQTGLRQGFGDVVAEGGYRMAERYEHPELFMGVKKQAIAGYDPRAMKGKGLGYATSNRGACHLKGMPLGSELSDPLTIEGRPYMVKWTQDQNTALDSVGLCLFCMGATTPDKALDVILSILELVTGVGYDRKSVLSIGETIWNLERLFNLKAGFTRKDDTLPSRMLEEPLPDGPAKGHVCELNVMLPEYYSNRGWDGNGIPTPEKLIKAIGI